jgi:hypothetical protein
MTVIAAAHQCRNQTNQMAIRDWQKFAHRIAMLLCTTIFVGGFASGIAIEGYFATHRPPQPNVEQGYVMPHKFVWGLFYITKSEDGLLDGVFAISILFGIIAASLHASLSKPQ